MKIRKGKERVGWGGEDIGRVSPGGTFINDATQTNLTVTSVSTATATATTECGRSPCYLPTVQCTGLHCTARTDILNVDSLVASELQV